MGSLMEGRLRRIHTIVTRHQFGPRTVPYAKRFYPLRGDDQAASRARGISSGSTRVSATAFRSRNSLQPFGQEETRGDTLQLATQALLQRLPLTRGDLVAHFFRNVPYRCLCKHDRIVPPAIEFCNVCACMTATRAGSSWRSTRLTIRSGCFSFESCDKRH